MCARRRLLGPALVLLAAALASCQDDGGSSDSAETGGETENTTGGSDASIAVTADWLGQTLSIVDRDLLVAGASTRDEVLIAEVDLGGRTPGPLELEITPDGRLAIVAVSPGFYDGIVGSAFGLPAFDLGGGLVIVDLETQAVVAELSPAHVPMGIAISPDGSTAYTANYGHTDAVGSTLSIVDLDAMQIVDDVEVGARPEQVSLSADGNLGIFNLAGDGTIRVFETADVAGTLSTPLTVSQDPSDVDFIEGTNLAVVANSAAPLNYQIIDVSDPANPTISFEGPAPGGFPYGATPIPGTTDFILTLANGEAEFVRIDANVPDVEKWHTVTMGVPTFPLGIAVDVDAGIGISAAIGADALVVVPLDGAPARSIPWTENGPTYVAIP